MPPVRRTTSLQPFHLAPLAPTAEACTRVRAHKVAPGVLEDDETGARLRITRTNVGNLTVSGVLLGHVKVAVDEATGMACALKRYRLHDKTLAAMRRESVTQTADYLTDKLVNEGMWGTRAASPLAISSVWITDEHVYGRMALMMGDMNAAHRDGLWGPATPHAAPTREEGLALRAVLLDLERLHGRGLAHCDIKPANIMHRNTPESAMLGDFTLVRPLGDRRAAPGTPHHMAPEQQIAKMLHQPVDDWARADVWGVGLSFLELIAGNPFDCHSAERQERFAAYERWHGVKMSRTRNPFKRIRANNVAHASLFKSTLGQLNEPWRTFFLRLLHPNPKGRPSAAEAREMVDGILGT